MAFFAKKKQSPTNPPTVRVIVNDECVSVKHLDNIPESPLRKVCSIEFVVLPAKARLMVQYDSECVHTSGKQIMLAEGFVGLKKL
jgi:hypothetical protein